MHFELLRLPVNLRENSRLLKCWGLPCLRRDMLDTVSAGFTLGRARVFRESRVKVFFFSDASGIPHELQRLVQEARVQ